MLWMCNAPPEWNMYVCFSSLNLIFPHLRHAFTFNVSRIFCLIYFQCEEPEAESGGEKVYEVAVSLDGVKFEFLINEDALPKFKVKIR